MGKRAYSWRRVPSHWALLVVLIWTIASPLAAQKAATLPGSSQSSEPTSTPTSEQPQLSRLPTASIRPLLLQLRSKLVELKTLSSEQIPSLTNIDGALSGAISLDKSDSNSSAQALGIVSSALNEATTSSTSASTSLTNASSTWTTVQTAQGSEATAVSILEADYAASLAKARRETRWWRLGALTAAGGLVGSIFGLKGAAIGAAAGAASAGVWWSVETFIHRGKLISSTPPLQ
jgi:hypothetical protein